MRALLAMFVVIAALLVVVAFPAAAPPPLFEPGQAYAFVWSCMPAKVAIALGGDTACYVELLTIVEVRKDGWLRVNDPHDHREWIVNPARAMEIRPMKLPGQHRV